MKFFNAFIFVVSFCLITASLPAAAERVETIAAVVNNGAVSASDVEERIKLVMASSGMPDNAEIRERLRPQIINSLIEEQLMLQEAGRLGITISDQEIEEGFARVAGQNNFSAEQFRAILNRQNIAEHTLKGQIRSQLAWSRVIQSQLRPQVTVSENEVDSTLARLANSAGKSQYLVSEIFLPVTAPADEPNVSQLAQRLTAQLAEGKSPFPRLASQFSQAAAAARGGDLGWVQEGQLSEELDQMLSRMKEGEISRPVRTLSGYHILFLRQKNTLSEATMPSRDELFNQLGLEQLDRLQRRYLLDLKSAAFIERRA